MGKISQFTDPESHVIDEIKVILKVTVSEKQSQAVFLLHAINDEIEIGFLSNIKSLATELQLKFTTVISAHNSQLLPLSEGFGFFSPPPFIFKHYRIMSKQFNWASSEFQPRFMVYSSSRGAIKPLMTSLLKSLVLRKEMGVV